MFLAETGNKRTKLIGQKSLIVLNGGRKVLVSEEEVTVAISPDEIENKQFTIGRRGFEREEVEEYLGRVARQIRRLDAELSEAEAAALAASTPVESDTVETPHQPKGPGPGATLDEDIAYFTDDRFTEFGDRMASLLRIAHEDAAEVRAKAESDAEAARAESEAAADTAAAAAAEVRAEAENYRAEVRAEAEAYREQVKAEAEGYREQVKAEATAEREAAAAEMAEARAQSNELLAQARSQADLLKHEADELSRAKIRENIDAAEKRLSILRTTEVSSRERISVAQQELEAALAKLNAAPLEELTAPEVADKILAEATETAESALPAIDVATIAEAEAEVEADEVEAEVEVEVEAEVEVEVDEAEADEVVDDEVEEAASEAEVIEAEVLEVEAIEVEVIEAEVTELDEDIEPEVDAAAPTEDALIEPADNHAGDSQAREVIEETAEIASEVAPATDSNGAKNTPWWAKKRKNDDPSDVATPPPPPPPPPGGAVSVVDSVPSAPLAPNPDSPMSGVAQAARLAAEEMKTPPASPESEDALARLVREAMQKAVEGARGLDN